MSSPRLIVRMKWMRLSTYVTISSLIPSPSWRSMGKGRARLVRKLVCASIRNAPPRRVMKSMTLVPAAPDSGLPSVSSSQENWMVCLVSTSTHCVSRMPMPWQPHSMSLRRNSASGCRRWNGSISVAAIISQEKAIILICSKAVLRECKINMVSTYTWSRARRLRSMQASS